jgi:TonB-dependent receptor
MVSSFSIGSLVGQTDRPANAESESGVVAGRVFNPRSGSYVANAVVQVQGVDQEVLTDAEGRFVLGGVPVGTRTLRVRYIGFPALEEEVTVFSGQTVRRELSLVPPDASIASGESDVVVLSEFVISQSRELDAVAEALSEQRYALNAKNVLSTGEFGFLAEGNAADFLKFMPGISVEETGGNSRDIVLNGVPSDFVPITIEGFAVASAGVGLNTSRSVAMDFVSINNLSRIEVNHAALPEHSGNAFAGSINLTPRSAFERAKPVFNYRAFMMGRSNEFDFDSTPGPDRGSSSKVRPGFEFSWLVPVNEKFGFTVTGGYSDNYSPEPLTQYRWHGGWAGTGNRTNFPQTTPDLPYATNYTIRDGAKATRRYSFGTTLDFRIGDYDRISAGLQWSYFDLIATNQTIDFQINRVASQTSTGTVSANGQGQVVLTNLVRHRINRTVHPTVVWYHNGPEWTWKVGLGYSFGNNFNKDQDKGAFNTSNASMSNVTISFADNAYLRPGSITVVDNAAGAVGSPIDPFTLSSRYALQTADYSQDTVWTERLTGYFDLSRDLRWRIPVDLKTGLRFEGLFKENRNYFTRYFYDGVGGNRSPAAFLDETYATREGQLGFPAIQGIDNYKLDDHLEANPGQFRLNEAGQYFNRINGSREATEDIIAGYFQAGIKLFERRLHLLGGVRVENTRIDSNGPLTDATGNYQRDAAGNIILGSNGRPLTIVPVNPNALNYLQLTFLERGYRVKTDYTEALPRFNASFRIRPDLILRASYGRAFGRPNLVQYSGAVTFPDLEDDLTGNDFFTVNNPDIEPWTSDAWTARLEYYFKDVGHVAIGAFVREYENFFQNVTVPVTEEFLRPFGLSFTEYRDAQVRTQINGAGTVRHDGLTIEYKQALTFLPDWARGVQVFANGTRIVRDPEPFPLLDTSHGDIDQPPLTPFKHSGNFGFSLSRERFAARLNWNFRDRKAVNQRAWDSTGVLSTSQFAYTYLPSRLRLDLDIEFTLTKNFGLFVNGRNVSNEPELVEAYGPETPDYARLRTRIDYGALWTFGIKGSF